MLKMFSSISEIDFRQLMDVYAETNYLSGAQEYSTKPENLQLLYAEQDFYVFLQAFFRLKCAASAAWTVSDVYVAAVRLEPYRDGLIVEALETMPSERRKGFGYALLQGLIDSLSASGTGKIYSHIDKCNIASLRLHEKCGFSIVSHDAVYVDGTYHPDSYTLCLEY